MAEPIHFEDTEGLKAWLRDQPHQLCSTIGTRAALRVLPLIFTLFDTNESPLEKKKRATLDSFRWAFVAWAANRYPTKIDRDSITLIAALAVSFAIEPADAVASAVASALGTVAADPSADKRIETIDFVGATTARLAAAAAGHAVTAALAVGGEGIVWDSIRADAQWRVDHEEGDLIQQPLWLIDVLAGAQFQANFPLWARTPFDAFDQSPLGRGSPWRVWLRWYRGILPNSRGIEPRSLFGEEVDIDLAARGAEFWDRDPDEVMTDIANIVAGGVVVTPTPSSTPISKSPTPNPPSAIVERLLLSQESVETPEALSPNAYVPFRGDAPSQTDDTLGRGQLALFLARRLHLIWCELNHCSPASNVPSGAGAVPEFNLATPSEVDTFIVHVDAPWGGGKTTFANFVARTLNPGGERLNERHFLRSVAPAGASPQDLKNFKLDEIFFLHPDEDQERRDRERKRWQAEARKPWIVAYYNAWQNQYVQPPWWHIFQTILGAVEAALKADIPGPFGFHSLARLTKIHLVKYGYQLFNSKFRTQLLSLILISIVFFLAWASGITQALGPQYDKLVAILAAAGITTATLLSVISQSFAPEFDFTAEHKQIGVRDPIGRFRRAFKQIVTSVKRPILLIIDDIDRCDPKTVVEVLRGFQTITRSSRIFVLVLGDRAWIEKAHEIQHKDFAGVTVGTENTLGERFVEKIFQLSFTLPAMTPEVRERFTRAVLDTPDGAVTTQVQTPQLASVSEQRKNALNRIEKRIAEANRATSVGDRERLVEQVERDTATDAAQGGISQAEVTALASKALVAAAASDSGYQREIANVLFGLAASLPNNPRQIKRIINAFAVYETVGRLYFNYRMSTDQGNENQSRRWRQLAIWTTLATEWPQTWRELARQPRYVDAAYDENEEERAKIRDAILKLEGDDGKKKVEQMLFRLINDVALSRLLNMPRVHSPTTKMVDTAPGTVNIFSGTRIDADAVYEFNRIMWEPGFPTARVTTIF